MRRALISFIAIFSILLSLLLPTALADISIGQGSIPGTAGDPATNETSQTPVFAVTVYEDENCLIQFSKVEKSSGRLVAKFRVTNHTNRLLTFQSDCFAVNGESINNIGGSDDVSPNSSGSIEFRLRDYDEDYFDFEHIKTIAGNFTIIDFNDDNFHNGRQSYDVNYSDIIVSEDAVPIVGGDLGQKFYTDDKVEISYLKVSLDGDKVNVHFRVQNKTTDVLTIQCDSLSLNGESSTRSSGSESIAPNSTGNIAIRCQFDLDYVDLNNITSLSGQLTVIDFGNDNFYNGRQSYDVRF